jgi:hypothetical protein
MLGVVGSERGREGRNGEFDQQTAGFAIERREGEWATIIVDDGQEGSVARLCSFSTEKHS